MRASIPSEESCPNGRRLACLFVHPFLARAKILAVAGVAAAPFRTASASSRRKGTSGFVW